MTNRIDRNAIPTDELTARMMIAATIRAAADYMMHTASRIESPILNPANAITDDDDYSPAAANIAAALINRSFDDLHRDDPIKLITDLLADDDFADDALTCDFASPITDMIYDD